MPRPLRPKVAEELGVAALEAEVKLVASALEVGALVALVRAVAGVLLAVVAWKARKVANRAGRGGEESRKGGAAAPGVTVRV